MKQNKSHWMIVACLLVLTGCSSNYDSMGKSRVEYAQKNHGDIVIAAIEERGSAQYINGIRLAIDEINQHNGLLGRPLKLHLEQSHQDFPSSIPMIKRIASNPKISAVMGHQDDDIVLPASIIYEQSQLLFFPPSTTSAKLSSYRSSFTFRMLQDDSYAAKQISLLTKDQGHKTIALLSARADEHRQFSLLFKEAIIKQGINISFNRLFFGETTDYRPLVADLKKNDFDAIFISAETKTTVRLIKQLREMGINKPVLSSGAMDVQEFKRTAAIAGNNTIAPTPYNVLSENTINKQFVTQYQDKYNQLPDALAAQGYDSVMLFANKVERAKTTLPSLLASTVRFSPPWTGVKGVYYFNEDNNVDDKSFFFQVLNNNQWQLIN